MPSNERIEELKKSVPIWWAAESRLKELSKRGDEWDALCPHHNDTTPSLQMYREEDGTYLAHCQACSVTYNIFTLIKEVDKVSFQEAVHIVESMAKKEVPVPISEPAKHAAPITLALDDFDSYADALRSSEAGQKWLQGRGISAETAEQFNLGYVQKPLPLVVSTNHPWYDKGWLLFPEIRNGRIVAVKYRSLMGKRIPKTETSQAWSGFAQRSDMIKSPLYNVSSITPFQDVFIVEGEIDCLTMEQAGFCSVSLPSAGTTVPRDAFMSASTRYLAGDTDETGTKAMLRLYNELGSNKTYFLKWPKPYKDANETFLKHCRGDIGEFKKLVRTLMEDARKPKKPANRQKLWTERGDEIKEEVVNWFWSNKFAMKEINIVAGYPDQGKGVLLASVVAKATKGFPLPGETENRLPAEVLWFSGEETVSSSTVPRIRVAGGDLTKVHFVRGVKIDHGASQEARAVALDSDVQIIRENVESRPAIRMIIVDPINSYFGNGNKNSSGDVRRVFGALKSLAENCDVAVVLVDHFNKNTMQRALQRLSGSQDVGASPRAAWVVQKDEEIPDVRHIACLKCNVISEEQKRGFEFKIVGTETLIDEKIVSIPVVEWGKLSTKSAEELISPIAEGGPDLKAAIAFYKKLLEAKVPRLQREVYAELESLGVGERTAKAARAKLGISMASGIIQSRDGAWWIVPKGSELEASELSIKQTTEEKHAIA